MSNQVFGGSKTGQSISGGLDIMYIITKVDINPDPSGSMLVESQRNLNKLIEAISLRAQPIWIGSVVDNGDEWVLYFALEKPGVWDVEDGQATLAETIDEVLPGSETVIQKFAL